MRHLQKLLVVGVIALIASAGLLSLFAFKPATASFNKNLIIDDMVFDNVSTMSEGDIQRFFESFIGSCLTNYHAPEPLSYFDYGGNVRASRVVYKAAQLWGINPQVILATLQKEQSLVSGDAGCAGQRYNAAMGMGCPDGGACPAPAYAGFHQQVTKGSWQLKYNKERALGNVAWNGDGNIFYPGPMTEGYLKQSNSSSPQHFDGRYVIDGESVYMSNGATASLYRYTPHFHGNQNFVIIFERWFGTIFGSDLVRTVSSPTVYLISGDKKYPIPSSHLLEDLWVLGKGVAFVSNSFLSEKTLGKTAARTVINSSGGVFFVDSNIKLPFGSCALVADYNISCGDEIALTEFQLRKLVTGPPMTNTFKATGGELYHVKDGQKRQALDRQSLEQAGLWTNPNVLQMDALYHVPLNSSPIIRDNTIAVNPADGRWYFYAGSKFTQVPAGLRGLPAFTSLPRGLIWGASIASQTVENNFNGYVRNSAGTAHYMLDAQGKLSLVQPTQWNATFYQLSDTFLQNLPASSQSISDGFIKAAETTAVYLVKDKKKHPILSWSDLVGMRPTSTTVPSLPAYYVSRLETGASVYAPASLAKSSSSAAVRMIDGILGARFVGSFAVTQELGIVVPSIRTVSQSSLDAHIERGTLGTKIQCGGQNYTGVKGRIYSVSGAVRDVYGWLDSQFIDLDTVTCSNLFSTAPPLTEFVLAPNGAIYYIEDGKKRPFAGYQAYVDAGGNASNTIAGSTFFLNTIPDGTWIY